MAIVTPLPDRSGGTGAGAKHAVYRPRLPWTEAYSSQNGRKISQLSKKMSRSRTEVDKDYWVVTVK